MSQQPLNAMLQGTAQGQAQAQRILPTPYQPQGKSAPQNPWQGELDFICDRLLSLGKQIKDQGEMFRKEADSLYESATDIAKINRTITEIAQKGPDA